MIAISAIFEAQILTSFDTMEIEEVSVTACNNGARARNNGGFTRRWAISAQWLSWSPTVNAVVSKQFAKKAADAMDHKQTSPLVTHRFFSPRQA